MIYGSQYLFQDVALMWFKNLIAYQLNPSFQLSADQLEDHLNTHKFSSCGKLQPNTFGWNEPLLGGTTLVHASQNCLLFSGCFEERVLPAGVIRDEMQRRLEQHQANSNQTTISRQVKSKLKDEVIFDLLPQAFTQKKITHGYFDLTQGWLIINSPAYSFADMIISTLRKSIGSLPVTLLKPDTSSLYMTHWLKQPEDLPTHIHLGDECELLQPYSKSIVHARHQTLLTDEVMQHINSGKQVTKLSIEWKDTLSCLIDDQMSIKKLKFFNTQRDSASDQANLSLADKMDFEFSEMILIFREFITELLQGLKAINMAPPVGDNQNEVIIKKTKSSVLDTEEA